MNTTVKPFLNRVKASSPVTALNIDQRLEGAPPEAVAAAKKLSQHCHVTHAQFEDHGGGATALMLVVSPKSDSEVAYDTKVFSYPEVMGIAECMHAMSKSKDSVCEMHTDVDDRNNQLYIECYYSVE